MTIGILGTGIGWEHGKRLQSMPDVSIAGIWGRTPAKADEKAALLGCKAIRDYHVLFEDPAVSLILVCVPTDLHERFVTEALRAGKHVFCETPLAYSAAQAERMVACERETGRSLTVGLFQNFASSVRHVSAQAKDGFPESVTLFRRTPPIWGRMRHIVFDLMMHDIDAALSIAGIPETVHATGLRGADSDFTHVDIRLGYPGKSVSIEGSSSLPLGYPFTAGFHAQGNGLAFEYRISFPKGGFETSFRSWDENGETENKLADVDPYHAELAYIIDCLASGKRPELASGERALAAIRIAEEAARLLG